MAFVTRYGNTVSEDGWRMVDQAECEWVSPCSGVTIQLRKGVPATVLGEFAKRFNERVEQLRDADTAGWTPTNDVPTSNHMAGTAMDLNWQSHPFRKRGTYGDRLPALRQLLDEFEGCVWWGGDWQSPIDEMHFQLNYPEGDSRLEVMATKLRGGFIPKDEPAEIIVREGQARGYTRGEIIAILSTGLQESNLNQNATDSTGHRGIFQQDGGYPDRETAEGNIRGFFDRLDAKRRNKGGVSPDIWKNIFWLQQRPSEATAEVAYARGRQHYLTEIQSHIDAATDLYNRYVQAQPKEDHEFMSALSNDEQRAMYDEIMKPRYSRSPLRHVGEGPIGNIETFEENIDGSVHVLVMWLLAAILKSPDHLNLLYEVAENTDPNRQWDANLAKAILNKITQMDASVGCPVATDIPAPASAPQAQTPPPSAPEPSTPLTEVHGAHEAPEVGPHGLQAELTALRAQVQALHDSLQEFLK